MAQPMHSFDNVSSILERIQSIATSSADIKRDQSTRAALLQASRELTASLEQPGELCSNVAYSACRNMCVRVADDLRVFDLLSERSPRTSKELAEATGAEEALLNRTMRTLAGMGFVGQVGKNEYAATPASEQMTLPSVRAGVKFFHNEALPIVHTVPAYFQANGYRLPRSMTDGPFQYAFDTSEDCYTFWSKKPGVMENFNTFMQGVFRTPMRLSWLQFFPVEEVCLKGFDEAKSPYSFVDVGGGKGHECVAVLKKYPNALGKFVVEDLPFVINDITDLDPRVERLPHNFLDLQPIKGARTYFLANILHNWANPVCHNILSRLREAMIPGYSKLIIDNIILPDENVPLRNSGLDMAMLVLHSGSQRGEDEWRDLIESAGFKVMKFWLPPGDGDGIIEAELPIS